MYYDFVPFNPPDFYKYAGKGDLSGYAKLKLVTIENVYIGSGFSRENNKSFILETIKDFDNKPIIPASSIKGTVRNICSAISDGCLPKNIPEIPKTASKIVKEKYKNIKNLMPKNINCNIEIDKKTNNITNYDCCIICDMFGIFGRLASRVSFIDFLPINKTSSDTSKMFDVCKVNLPSSPNPYRTDDYYIDTDTNKFKGYKFYCTGFKGGKPTEQINIETIKPKSQFVGKVFFKNLTKDELQLLLFACATSGDINLKIGGFKGEGFGEVACYCQELMINGEIQNPSSWTKNYPKGKYGKKFEKSIEILMDILCPPNDES